MIQVGIFTGYFPYTLAEQAAKIRALGFNTVQLDLTDATEGMRFGCVDVGVLLRFVRARALDVLGV